MWTSARRPCALPKDVIELRRQNGRRSRGGTGGPMPVMTDVFRVDFTRPNLKALRGVTAWHIFVHRHYDSMCCGAADLLHLAIATDRGVGFDLAFHC